jgi:hypothetical protein
MSMREKNKKLDLCDPKERDRERERVRVRVRVRDWKLADQPHQNVKRFKCQKEREYPKRPIFSDDLIFRLIQQAKLFFRTFLCHEKVSTACTGRQRE